MCYCEIVQKNVFKNFDFSPFLGEIFTKKGSKPPNEIENMPLQSDKSNYFVLRCHFQPQKSKNIKNFSYPKIFQNLKATISWLLFTPECSATAKIKGFRISFQYFINTLP